MYKLLIKSFYEKFSPYNPMNNYSMAFSDYDIFMHIYDCCDC